MKVHLITSRDGFELISLDWRTSVQRFRTADIDGVEAKGTIAVLTMNPNHKLTTVFLNTHPETCDTVVEALTVAPPPSSAALIRTSRDVKLEDEIRQLLHAIGCQNAAHFQLVDAFACVLRARHSDDYVQNGDQATKSAMADFRRFLVATLCGGVLKCVEAAGSKWYVIMAEACVQTISKVGQGVSIFCGDLVEALPHFPEGVAAAATQVRRETIEASERAAARTPLHDAAALAVVNQVMLTLLAGVVVGMYAIDCEALAAKVVEFTKSLPAGRAQTSEVLQAQSRFIRAITCFMDGKRYESAFHWVFCVWDFKDAGEGQ
jgi:hypothetical protein